MILLDTDHVTLLQWGGEKGMKIHARLRLLGLAKNPPTTIITYEEQMRGWMGRIAISKSVTDEVRQYFKLRQQLAFFGTLNILDFTELAATEYQRLRALPVRIGAMDLKIAAIALANHATIWSRNLKDFRKVPGLYVEDATLEHSS